MGVVEGEEEVVVRGYIVIVVLLLISCANPNGAKSVEYVEGRQLLKLDDSSAVKMIAPDSIELGEEFVARIFMTDTALQVIDAFLDCDTTGALSIDTATQQVSGCATPLFVKSDTLRIGFRPTDVGMHTFADIAILTRNPRREYRLVKYTFNYKVVDQ